VAITFPATLTFSLHVRVVCVELNFPQRSQLLETSDCSPAEGWFLLFTLMLLLWNIVVLLYYQRREGRGDMKEDEIVIRWGLVVCQNSRGFQFNY